MNGNDRGTTLLGFVGDLLVDRPTPPEVFAEVRDLLGAPQILFGNLESPYTDEPDPAVTSFVVLCAPAHNLDVFAPAGFHVLSLANNHIVDAGPRAMLDTRSRLRAQGVQTCGAGTNLSDARRPAIVERDGLRVGFLAYASIFPHGYEARSNMAGLAPLRAYNHYHSWPTECHAPGYLPTIETLPDPTDHRHLIEDIQQLRPQVDLVVASFHWGDHLRPFVVTDHEIRTARLCIDRGADLVLGHHHHTLRGIEWYGGKPIFYGLGHFVFDHRLVITEELATYFASVDPDSHAVLPREGWPLLPLHPDTRMTAFCWARTERGAIVDAGFVPCRLRPDGRVVPVDPGSAEGREVIDYVARGIRSQRLNGRIVTDSAPLIGGHRSVRVVPLDSVKA